MFLIFKANFDFSVRIGMDIHGLIGGDLLKNFIVEIDYIKKRVRFTKKSIFKLKKPNKWEKIPIKIVKNKPYISIDLESNKKKNHINLLIDSGSGDALWMFQNSKFPIPKKSIDDYLGSGLSGAIHGKKAKINALNIGNYKLLNVLVSYPDSTYIQYTQDGFIRNGIVGGEILKRFKVILNYSDKIIYLKKNKNFTKPFLYNKSGLDIVYNGKVLVREKQKKAFETKLDGNNVIDLVSIYSFYFKNSYIINDVKPNSSAEISGLKKGDVILRINGRSAYDFSLQEIIQKLSGTKNKYVRITINRNGIAYKFKVALQDFL